MFNNYLLLVDTYSSTSAMEHMCDTSCTWLFSIPYMSSR